MTTTSENRSRVLCRSHRSRALQRSLVASFLLLLLPYPAAAAALKIATISPDGTSWMKMMREGAKAVAKRTDGRVKLRFYPGGVMGNDRSVLRKIRVGQLHGGAVTPGTLGVIYADALIYTLPLLFRSFAEVDYVRQRMDSLIIDGLEKKGFVCFGLADGGFAYVMSNKPLERVGQLKKQRVWVPEGDRISKATLEAFGVSPIQLPLTDVLTGLQTGLIDTVATSPTGAIALQWHTRVRYLTNVPLAYLFGALVIQQKAVERLSAADQKVLAEVMQQTFRKIDRQNRRDNQAALRALRKQGIKFVEPSGAERDEWRKRVQSTIAKLGREGVYSPAVLKQLHAHLSAYRKKQREK